MKYRLDSPHYIDDKLLPAGTEIGDETAVSYRYAKDVPTTDPNTGKKSVLKAGSAMPPSREMTPLDDEAKGMFEEHFKEGVPDRDPTKPIPLQGTNDPIKQPAAIGNRDPNHPDNKPKPSAPYPAAKEPPKTGMHTPPPGHDSSKNPGDSKDTETAKAPDVKKL